MSLIELCPKCKRMDRVKVVSRSYCVCEACHYAWECGDPNQLGWVCPKHRTELRATIVQGTIDLYCPICKGVFTVPEDLTEKIDRALVIEEEI